MCSFLVFDPKPFPQQAWSFPQWVGALWKCVSFSKKQVAMGGFWGFTWTPKVRVGNSTAEIYGFRSVVQSWGSHCEWLLGTKQIYKENWRDVERSKKAQWWPWPLWRLFTWPRLVAIIPRAAQARNLWCRGVWARVIWFQLPLRKGSLYTEFLQDVPVGFPVVPWYSPLGTTSLGAGGYLGCSLQGASLSKWKWRIRVSVKKATNRMTANGTYPWTMLESIRQFQGYLWNIQLFSFWHKTCFSVAGDPTWRCTQWSTGCLGAHAFERPDHFRRPKKFDKQGWLQEMHESPLFSSYPNRVDKDIKTENLWNPNWVLNQDTERYRVLPCRCY